jgi:hypothetical protein
MAKSLATMALNGWRASGGSHRWGTLSQNL